MSEMKRCPQCQAEIPAGAPEGLCPQCLLQAGLASHADAADPKTAPYSPSAASFVPPTPAELQAAFPQLEMLDLLGKGGMGAVYRARQPGLDRLVAIKILPPEISRDPAFAERFTREARALARLNHPNIVGVYDFGQTSGYCYFIMEYIDGVNLRQAMRAGEMKPAAALKIVPQICDALQFAHDEGIVHRDIKPENILLDKKGRVKIADFGLAKLLGKTPHDVSLTGTQQVMGTLHYMAPEQLEGSRDVDHRADIYSLGVTFYEMLTGELPIGRFAPPSQKVQIDVRLDEVVLRSLEKEPEQRYQHASEMKTDMETIASKSPAPESAPSSSEPNPAAPPDSYLGFVVYRTAMLFVILLVASNLLRMVLKFFGTSIPDEFLWVVGGVILIWGFLLLNAVWFCRVEMRAAEANQPRRIWLFQVLGALQVLVGSTGIFMLMADFLVPLEIPAWLAAQPELENAYKVYRIGEAVVRYVLLLAFVAVGVGLVLRLAWGRRSAIALLLIGLAFSIVLLGPLEFIADFKAITADPVNVANHDTIVNRLIFLSAFQVIGELVP